MGSKYNLVDKMKPRLKGIVHSTKSAQAGRDSEGKNEAQRLMYGMQLQTIITCFHNIIYSPSFFLKLIITFAVHVNL